MNQNVDLGPSAEGVPDIPPNAVGANTPAERPPCDIVMFHSAQKFSEEMLRVIPELQGVAIIPLWAPELNNIPNGILRLRNESIPYVDGLLRMIGRITAFMSDAHRDLFVQLRALKQIADRVGEEIKEKTGELDTLNTAREQNNSGTTNH